jgi:hypothetical protein
VLMKSREREKQAYVPMNRSHFRWFSLQCSFLIKNQFYQVASHVQHFPECLTTYIFSRSDLRSISLQIYHPETRSISIDRTPDASIQCFSREGRSSTRSRATYDTFQGIWPHTSLLQIQPTKPLSHKPLSLKTHDSFTRQERTPIQRFPETMVTLNTQESSLAVCKVLLLPRKVSSASVHYRRCQLVERATMSESASMWHEYDPEVVLPRCSSSWLVNVLLPTRGYIVNHSYYT